MKQQKTETPSTLPLHRLADSPTRRFCIWGLYAVAAAVILIFGLWHIVITNSMIAGLIENSVKSSNMSVDITNLKKGLFFNVTIDRVTLRKSDKTLLSIENASGKINPLSLLIMRLALHFKGSVGSGSINGGIDLFKGNKLVDINITDAHIEEIPFFSLIGLDGRGVLSAGLRFQNRKGETRLDVRDARLKTGNFGGMTVPLVMFDSARGAMTSDNGTLKIVSFSLEGKGIYARIKGTITGVATDLTMELMPDKTFIENNPVLSLIENYKVSPGLYSIPIRSNLPF